MELVNTPTPVPSEVWLPVTTGFVEILQQIPRAVMAEPPSELILPPLKAVVLVIDVTVVVVSVGKIADGFVGPKFSVLISFAQPKAITDNNSMIRICFIRNSLVLFYDY